MKLTSNENKENEITICSRTSSNLAKYNKTSYAPVSLPPPEPVRPAKQGDPNGVGHGARRVRFNEHVQVKELIELDSLQSLRFHHFHPFHPIDLSSIYYAP